MKKNKLILMGIISFLSLPLFASKKHKEKEHHSETGKQELAADPGLKDLRSDLENIKKNVLSDLEEAMKSIQSAKSHL